MLHSLLLTVLLVQLSSPRSTLLALKQSNLPAVLHALLVVLNGLPIILQIVMLNGLIIVLQMSGARWLHLPHTTVSVVIVERATTLAMTCAAYVVSMFFTLSATWHQTLLLNSVPRGTKHFRQQRNSSRATLVYSATVEGLS